MGLFLGGMFWQKGGEDLESVLGILFQILTYVMLGPQIFQKGELERRPIFYRQRNANFYPTWTFVLGRSLAGVPCAIIDGLLFGSLVYFMAGLGGSGVGVIWNFITYQIILLVTTMATGAFFSIFSAALPDLSSAMGIAVFATVINYLFSGFTVLKSVIPRYVFPWL